MDNQTAQPQPVNDVTALRTTLFATLSALSDKENPMDIDRAKSINEVAQTIINSAKVEVDALKIIGGTGSGFIPALPPQKPAPRPAPRPALENLRDKGVLSGGDRQITHPAVGVTRHTCT